jgi:hypothetical protein
MIAGGASLAPRRWSLCALAIDRRRMSLYLATARMTAQKHQELRVVVRRIAGVEQVLAAVGGHRPVVVLAAAVDAGERLFVQQAGQAVLFGRRRRISMIRFWWSVARLLFSKIGASSYWLGATSLWRVLTGRPA